MNRSHALVLGGALLLSCAACAQSEDVATAEPSPPALPAVASTPAAPVPQRPTDTVEKWGIRNEDRLTALAVAQQKLQSRLQDPEFAPSIEGMFVERLARELREAIDNLDPEHHFGIGAIPDPAINSAWEDALASMRQAANAVMIAASGDDPAADANAAELLEASGAAFAKVSRLLAAA